MQLVKMKNDFLRASLLSTSKRKQLDYEPQMTVNNETGDKEMSRDAKTEKIVSR